MHNVEVLDYKDFLFHNTHNALNILVRKEVGRTEATYIAKTYDNPTDFNSNFLF